MTNSRLIRLCQQGYRHMAVFNNDERAKARAALHRKQGHDAAVVPITNSNGIITFAVYVKTKEADHG